MKISIIKPGILCTVQDLGREGFLSEAVPRSGVMDRTSAIRANLALGNHIQCATLEFTYGHASFLAESDIIIAYTGRGARLKIGDKILPDSRALLIPEGNQVQILNPEGGMRTYISILGGWDVPEILGSRSTFLLGSFGGFEGRALKKGDILQNPEILDPSQFQYFAKLFNAGRKYSNWTIPDWIDWKKGPEVRVIPGPESDWFEKESLKAFFSGKYTIGNDTNRMGINLEGEKIKKISNRELISTGLVPGTIQIKGNGNPIVLMADCQTTGGYPRIAQVAWVDMPILAQLRPMDHFYFKEIDKKEAERLYIDQEEEISRMYRAIRLKI